MKGYEFINNIITSAIMYGEWDGNSFEKDKREKNLYDSIKGYLDAYRIECLDVVKQKVKANDGSEHEIYQIIEKEK